MTLFWIVAALLIAGALLLILPPLFSRNTRLQAATPSQSNLSILRDQLRELDAEKAAGTLDEAQYHSARSELEQRVIEDVSVGADVAPAATGGGRWLATSLAVVLPAAAISLYLYLGTPSGINPPPVSEPTTANGQPHAITPQMIQTMVQRLEQKLQENPENPEGWAMLARSYAVLGRYPEASVAYASATALQPDNAQLLADYADALGMANGKSLHGEPEAIIKKALKVDPNNIKALALAATVAFENKDYPEASQHWQKILSLVPPNSQAAEAVSANLREAQALSGKGPIAEEAAAPAVAAGAGTVSGLVKLDPAFKGRVADTDTVFIFARFADGRRGPPLAILRKTVKELPIKYTLDDSMSMMPAFSLSTAGQVVVGARISKSGIAGSHPGDFEGYSAPVTVGAKDVNIAIATEVK